MTTTDGATAPARPTGLSRTTHLVAACAAGAVAATAVWLVAAGAGIGDGFAPLQPPGFAFAAVIGVLAGAAGWAVVRRVARDPRAVLRWLVPAVVGLSLVPDALLLVTGEPGADVAGVAALMAMHVLVAVTAVPFLARAMPLPAARG